MHNIHQTITMPYSAFQIFQLVADVEKYPEFMPWCETSEINEYFSENNNVVSLYMKFIGVTYFIQTKNFYYMPNKIELHLLEGPFSYLYGLWLFEDIKYNSCKVDFKMQYEFKNSIMSLIIQPFFNNITSHMIGNFIKRANCVYKI
ncbi:Persistence and stress-resistance toxin PasT [Candidatus Kinetoplastibacterium sorsogonicusi]|uniref:Persistence and stress-resistance toxin PasT n=1 Tax=Candidatus Kinetoplastidibacterium kentomonadis TaxID=1576550 RepID=A0A3Q8EWY5_9PROT|nr:type II toxin-antitoxin system RatA family toxin [Candidatus Kinetoplastibacterium sorsogonicusi]AWD32438.1 Persistence and stress-resistance toxin PasT [Candidatus Kinetoplastibacterium sorsogonicusi]